jgi:hypothetical protein
MIGASAELGNIGIGACSRVAAGAVPPRRSLAFLLAFCAKSARSMDPPNDFPVWFFTYKI